MSSNECETTELIKIKEKKKMLFPNEKKNNTKKETKQTNKKQSKPWFVHETDNTPPQPP